MQTQTLDRTCAVKKIDRGQQVFYYRAFRLGDDHPQVDYKYDDATRGRFVPETGQDIGEGVIEWSPLGDIERCESFPNSILAERRAHARAFFLAGVKVVFSA